MFVLLVLGGFFIFGIKIPKKKNIVSISKATAKDKRKHVDEKFSKLGLSLHYLISFRVWHISTLKKDLH